MHTVHGTEELCCLCVQGVSTDPDKAGPRIAEVGGRKMLQLLNDCSGAFRPGILTALVGSSGAGKTTLMDVLAGRKTSARTNLLLFNCLSWSPQTLVQSLISFSVRCAAHAMTHGGFAPEWQF